MEADGGGAGGGGADGGSSLVMTCGQLEQQVEVEGSFTGCVVSCD